MAASSEGVSISCVYAVRENTSRATRMEEEVMSSHHGWISVLLAVITLGAPVQGGFINLQCVFPGDPDGNDHVWSLDSQYSEGAAQGLLLLQESYRASGPDSVIVSGQTDSDPIFHVTKTVVNETDFVWTGYQLTLDGSATFEPTASSDKFTVVQYPDEQTVLFGEPLPVPPGESVTFNVDINVLTVGPFEFTLTQLAIPEPASMVLLALGTGLLIRRRR